MMEFVCKKDQNLVTYISLDSNHSQIFICDKCAKQCSQKQLIPLQDFKNMFSNLNTFSFQTKQKLHSMNARLAKDLNDFKDALKRNIDRKFMDLIYFIQKPFFIKYYGAKEERAILFLMNKCNDFKLTNFELRQLLKQLINDSRKPPAQQWPNYLETVKGLLSRLKDPQLMTNYSKNHSLFEPIFNKMMGYFKSRYDMFLELYMSFESNNDYESALKACDQYLEVQKETKVFQKRAQCLYKLKRYEETVDLYNELLTKSDIQTSQKYKWHFYIANCYRNMKNFTLAKKMYDMADKSDRLHLICMFNKAICNCELKDYEPAKDDLLKVIESKSTDDQLISNAYSNLGIVYQHLGQKDEAQKSFAKAKLHRHK